MTATAAKAPKKAANPAKKPATPKLKPADVLAWLTAHPAFFAENADKLSQLSVPKKGGNILSLHAAKAERADKTSEKLQVRHKQMVATAHANASAAGSLFTATLNVIGCATLAELRTYLQTDVRDDLNLEAARLWLVGTADTATTLTAQTIENYFPHDPTIHLRTLTDAEDRGLYGPKGKMLKSDCLLHLTGSGGKTIGLLALASADETRFHAGQATDLARFFGQVFARCLQRTTHGNA